MTDKIIHGDCLDVMNTLEAQSIDAIITDLPYGTTRCKWDVVIPFVPMWESVKRLLKPKGAFVTTASQPFTSTLIVSNIEWFKYCWVWDKGGTSNFFSVKYEPLASHEDIVVFGKSTITYNPQMGQGIPNGHATNSVGKIYKHETRGTTRTVIPDIPTTAKYPRSIINIFKSTKTHRLHPTQKPIELYDYLVRTYTNESDTILDFCCGSGTTGVACIKNNRNFIGIEKEAEYVAIAERRCAEASMQGGLF